MPEHPRDRFEGGTAFERQPGGGVTEVVQANTGGELQGACEALEGGAQAVGVERSADPVVIDEVVRLSAGSCDQPTLVLGPAVLAQQRDDRGPDRSRKVGANCSTVKSLGNGSLASRSVRSRARMASSARRRVG